MKNAVVYQNAGFVRASSGPAPQVIGAVSVMPAGYDRRAKKLDAHRSSTRRVLRESLAERLPLDQSLRTEWRVAFAFAARALDQPDLAVLRNQTGAAIREQLAQAITNGKECGEVPAETDALSAAAGLLTLVNGLGLHTCLDPTIPASVVLSELDRALKSVLPGKCRYD